MDIDSVCTTEKLTFLKYLNERVLLYCITLLTFFSVGVLLYVQSAYTFFEKQKIPRGNLPLFPFGNIKDVLFKNTTLHTFLWKYYNRFKRKEFKFAGLYLFFKPSILVVNPKIISKILREDEYFIDVNKNTNADKKKIHAIFVDGKLLESFLNRYNDNIKDTIIGNLTKEEVESVTRDFFLETTSLVFGVNSCEILEEINDLLKQKTQASFCHYFSICYPFFKRTKSVRDLREYFDEILDNRKKNDIRKTDLVQSFIDLYNEEKFPIDELVTEMFGIFVDNITFCYSTVLLCLHELASNNEVQDELIGEIRRFNNEHQSFNEDNLKSLGYLDAVVKEVLRKYPPVATIFKQCQKDYKNTELNLDLPKGLFVFVSTFGIHHDSNNYTDPESFDPDRFLEENGKYIKENTYMPFGVGTKSDIGMRFSTLHIKLCLISIFSMFKVKFQENSTRAQIEFDNKKLSLHPKEPLSLKFELL